MSIQTKELHHNQSGIASIIITLVTMLVITLIVLGFATITRREQNNTLDQQMSTKAFYAAETAVNDVRQIVQTSAGSVPARTNCTGSGAPYPTVPQWLNSPTKSVGYTCLLVNPSPDNLQHSGVGDNPWVVPVASADGITPITSIQIQWAPSVPVSGTPGTDCPTSLTFSPSNSWQCGYGLIRMDLVPTDTAALSSSGRSGLVTNQLTGFFEALNSGIGASLDYSQRGKANIEPASCPSSPGAYDKCTDTITGLSGTSYTLRLLSWYQMSNITITAFNGISGVQVKGQVVVDSTGFASGVLRRIQVRLPVTSYSGNIPEFAIQSNGSICKRFSTTPGYFNIATDLPAPPGLSDTNLPVNPLCQHITVGTPGPGG